MSPPPTLLSVSLTPMQAAKLARCSLGELWASIDAGKLRAVRIDGSVRLWKRDVRVFLRSRRPRSKPVRSFTLVGAFDHERAE
jgi:hypothetical protein